VENQYGGLDVSEVQELRRLRDERLNVSWFQYLRDARRKIAAWREKYNESRPHRADQ